MESKNVTIIHRGAEHDLKKLIGTHLFVICCNNSGTTFLRNALATSRKTWNLSREGQHTFGFSGPSSIGSKAHKRWASEDKWIDLFRNPDNYDWEATKKSWYFQAVSKSKDSKVFVEKSPPFLLILDQLVREFKNPKFLFMVRNPYAVVEGICRKSPMVLRKDIVALAAKHVLNCLKFQKNNIEAFGEMGIHFTYEQMCDSPAVVESQIRGLVPELDDLALDQKIKVKKYYEPLRNMNDQQIERLDQEDLKIVNSVFEPDIEYLEYFKYPIIS